MDGQLHILISVVEESCTESLAEEFADFIALVEAAGAQLLVVEVEEGEGSYQRRCGGCGGSWVTLY